MTAGEGAVKIAWEAVEQLRGQLASSVGGTATTIEVELDKAMGKWHDALCHSVIAVMQEFLKRNKERGVGDSVSSLVSEAREELKKAAKAFKVGGERVVAANKGVVSRYSDGVGEIEVDRGWSEFFKGASCARPMLATVEAAMGRELKGAAEWAVQQVEGKSEPYLRLYSLESPLCYDVNAAMREVAFRGERERYEPMKDFAYSLHRAMMSQPKYEGTVFRAIDFRVSESLYSVGAVVTMPHPTSASETADQRF